jgi:DNA-binding CsgD family transcriptional regulator
MRSRHLPGSARPLERIRDSRGIVMIGDDLGVELCTEQARLWLAEYFPAFRSRYGTTLPAPMERWARKRLDDERIGRHNPQTVRDPLVQAQGDRYLSIEMVVDHAKGEHLLLLAEEALASPASSLGSLGLTPREAEVLSWVAQGKNNLEIGMILEVSARTVQKHLEHVFQKMGVESRTAATLRAWQASRYALLARP